MLTELNCLKPKSEQRASNCHHFNRSCQVKPKPEQTVQWFAGETTMERCSEKSHLPPISWTTLFQETASSQPSPLSCRPRAMSQLKSDTFALALVQQDIKETVLIAMEVLTRSANVPIYHVKPAFNILHRGSIVRITHCSIERSWFIWFLIEPASFTEFQPSLRPCQCRRQRHIQVAKTHTKTRTKTSHYSIEQT